MVWGVEKGRKMINTKHYLHLLSSQTFLCMCMKKKIKQYRNFYRYGASVLMGMKILIEGCKKINNALGSDKVKAKKSNLDVSESILSCFF